jgi:hypothetical protein
MQIGPYQTEGARRLLRYLSKQRITLHKFCQLHGIERIKAMRAVRGMAPKRISVDFANSIQVATDGLVRVELWSSDTIRTAKAA